MVEMLTAIGRTSTRKRMGGKEPSRNQQLKVVGGSIEPGGFQMGDHLLMYTFVFLDQLEDSIENENLPNLKFIDLLFIIRKLLYHVSRVNNCC